MPIDFYYTPSSAPCRAVILTANAVGVELNYKRISLGNKDHLRKEFLKINPQHTVPTLVDDGFALWESRAIITYLVNKYGKNDSLYPKDPKKKATVDQRLYFDMEVLYARFADCYYPSLFNGVSGLKPEHLAKVKEAFEILNKFLEGQEFVAGNNLTVADLSLVATVSTYDVMGFDLPFYKNVLRWYEKVKITTPGYDEGNEKNLDVFRQQLKDLKKKQEAVK